ncbi:NADPH-dependent F420 reductase [Micromonospora sp. B11E3]|uniref:NADPH-dependent F420 reductase n=1 Tax=Micromonospora sp. B11E3 TaxID=3153562 RepID=UPI00325EE885
MRIAIIGAGNVGGALADAATRAGHDVTVVAAHRERADAVAERTNARAADSPADAARDADVVVLAVPAQVAAPVLRSLGDEANRPVVVDVTNPLNDSYSDLTTFGTSVSEQLAAQAPNARIVKAFNTLFASRHGNPTEDGQRLDGFYAGDDPEAKATVARLLESLGYRPIDAGGLRMARSLEEMAFLNITLNARNGWPWQSAVQLVGPTG